MACIVKSEHGNVSRHARSDRHQAAPHAKSDGFRAAARTQLAENLRHVKFGGVAGDAKAARYFFVAETVGEQEAELRVRAA